MVSLPSCELAPPIRTRHPSSSMSTRKTLLIVVAVAAAGLALWYVEQRPKSEALPVGQASPPAPAAAPAQPASAAGEEYPVQAPAAPYLESDQDITAALVELLGRTSVSTFIAPADFARRLVATVDNLGRAHAPPSVWPVVPTPDRFVTEDAGGSTVISRDNSARYTPFVLLVETVDVGRAVELYRRMYPLLQAAYRELGYPRGEFNKRLIEVIDLLMVTPHPERPLKVQLLEVKGPVASARPWVRYEFVDPQLESLASGQKILLRVGSVNQKRLLAKLAEFRAALTKPASPR